MFRRLAFTALFLGACQKPTPPADDVFRAHLKGGQTISISRSEWTVAESRLRFEREQSLSAGPLPKDLSEHLQVQMINDKLLAREAQRLKVSVSTSAVALELDKIKAEQGPKNYQKSLIKHYQSEEQLQQLIKLRLLRSALVYREGPVKVSEEELKAAFAALPPAQKQRAAHYQIAQILVLDRKLADNVHKMLAWGKDFAEMAKKHSVGPSAAQGGLMGWVQHGDLPDKLEKESFALEKGKYTGVIATQQGYHLVKLLDQQPERPKTFAEEKARLQEQLYTQKLRSNEQRLIKRLRAQIERLETIPASGKSS